MSELPKTPTPRRQPISISALFTPAEWITCNIIAEAHSLNPVDYPLAADLQRMSDMLMYGGLHLTDLGYQFHGLTFRTDQLDDNGRPQLDIHTPAPLGGSPGLIGLGPVKLCEIALSFLTENCPDADTDIDMIRTLLDERKEQWADGWDRVGEQAEAAMEQVKLDEQKGKVN